MLQGWSDRASICLAIEKTAGIITTAGLIMAVRLLSILVINILYIVCVQTHKLGICSVKHQSERQVFILFWLSYWIASDRNLSAINMAVVDMVAQWY